MTNLDFTIGFIIGSLFTTALMFTIKKIFFNFPQLTQTSPKPKENKNIIQDVDKTNPTTSEKNNIK